MANKVANVVRPIIAPIANIYNGISGAIDGISTAEKFKIGVIGAGVAFLTGTALIDIAVTMAAGTISGAVFGALTYGVSSLATGKFDKTELVNNMLDGAADMFMVSGVALGVKSVINGVSYLVKNRDRAGEILYANEEGFVGRLGDGSVCNGTDKQIKRMNVGDSGHHVPGVRKTKNRKFEISRNDKTRPTIFSIGSDPGYDHWRFHNAERKYVGPRQGDFKGSNDELFDAYRKAYKGLDDIKVDVKSPDGKIVLGKNVTPSKAVDLIQNWLKENNLY